MAFVHTCALTACTDPGIFIKGGAGPMARKQPEQRFFFCFFFSPQLILQFTGGVQWFYYRENYTFPRIQRGSNIFRGEGVQCLPGKGIQMLIYIEPHTTCDFPGGSRPPIPPLDPHMNRGAVKLIEKGVWICGQTNMHLQCFKKANIW